MNPWNWALAGGGGGGSRRHDDSGRFRLTPRLVMGLALAYLAVAWLLFIAVDVWNLFGSRDFLVESPLVTPLLWYHLFTEAGLTEIVQWLTLAVLTLTCGALWGRLTAGKPMLDTGERETAAKFWLLMAVTAGLLLIEDAGNPRLTIATYARSFLFMFDAQAVGTVAELAYYAVLASIPIYALLRYGRPVIRHVETRNYLLVGFVAYGTAGFASATRHVGEWYMAVGGWIHDNLLGGELLIRAGWDRGMLEFFLMDYIFEESLELLAAALLLAGAAAFLNYISSGSS